jgi:hypothetical protein
MMGTTISLVVMALGMALLLLYHGQVMWHRGFRSGAMLATVKEDLRPASQPSGTALPGDRLQVVPEQWVSRLPVIGSKCEYMDSVDPMNNLTFNVYRYAVEYDKPTQGMALFVTTETGRMLILNERFTLKATSERGLLDDSFVVRGKPA